MPAPVDQESHAHHYVPQWYQRLFLPPGQQSFHYLDLSPEPVTRGDPRHKRRSLLRWGPKKCFYEDDLYTLRIGEWSSDQVETRFFGAIDSDGAPAVKHFASFDGYCDETHEAVPRLLRYMDAQRSRTPRGLDWLRNAIDLQDQNATLVAMRTLYQYHSTMWGEAVWEVVRARQSETKFIVIDEPVTLFNPRSFPVTQRYPNDANLGHVGTRTIFPLSLDACLIMTHVQWTRDPWSNALRPRTNARSYDQGMMNLTQIQYGRELEELEVLRINYIMKKRVVRRIAAAREEWLYPEQFLQTTHWSKLDDDWFLLPNLWKVSFSGGVAVGYRGGRSFAADEYGRRAGRPDYQEQTLHDREWISHLRAREAWALKRDGKSIAHKHNYDGGDAVADELAAEYIAEHRARQANRGR